MGTFLVYILKSAVCLAVFYLFYRLQLSKETFHRFNRIALLGVMVLSCLLPLIQITVKEASPVNMQVMSMEDLLLMYQWNNGATIVEEGSHTLRWQEMLVLVYFAGLLFVMVRHLWSLGRMLFLIRHSRCEKLDHGVRLVVHQRDIAPFSWMRYIVISETDLKEGGHYILVHEQAHIRLRHSWDLLLTELCAWVQWFNPAIWLLKQELQNIHEYEADEEVLRQGIQAKEYQMLLIKKAVGARLYSIANSFNHSSLKKRITMMIRKKSNPWARAKYLYVLPLAAVTVAAFARPEISQPLDEISSVKVNDLSAVLETYADKNVSNPAEKELQLKKDSSAQKVVMSAASDNRIFDVVEQMPEFPGGMRAGLEFMARNLKYPTKAQEAGKQGRVIVQFIVQKDGSLSDLHVLHPVDPWLDAEAIRVIGSMPKWKPGMQDGQAVAVKFNLPVTFALEGPKNKPQAGKDDVVVVAYGTDSDAPADVPTIRMHQNGKDGLEKEGASPLVLIDETEVSTETMNKLDPQQIESITVLKDASATAKYGEKGKNGVILITTKKK
ncbi:M56 family metallopeptidase [Bacteroides mediterraneensis]|uniref:M56 family metallopeptidase n=1 Tax=Bacteroides mediterraneensis TaxID=1841856 RepID=UPI001955FEFB|nr:M56 family metallopeptidase [Bacteroides mediterraneensis]MBM6781478.1 TonB family protein [Bacteroides mediterraneensis]